MGRTLQELSSLTQVSDTDLFLIDTISDGSKKMTVAQMKSLIKPATAGTADKAVADNLNQQIDSTYIKSLSISGTTVTVTKGDNTSSTISTQDTTYSTGDASTAGLTKLYTGSGNNTDGTMTQSAITSAIGAVDVGVTSIAAGTGLTGGTVTSTGTLSLATVDSITAGSYGPSSAVSGTNGTTLSVPKLSVDSYGRVTAIENITYTSVDTTYGTGNGTTSGLTKLYTGTGNNTDGTMTQDAITTLLGNINSFEVEVVNSLPTGDNIHTHTIYLVPSANPATQNAKDEYIRCGDTWEHIGTTTTDLTNYYTKTESDTLKAKIWATLGLVENSTDPTDTGFTSVDARLTTLEAVDVGVTSLTAGTGLTGGTVTSTGTIALDASGVTAGSYGPSTDVTGSDGNTISVPYITVDTYGRVTSIANKTYTSVDNNNTYTPAALGFGYGTCATAEATAAKEVTLTGYELVTNGIIAVNFTNAVPANATMSVNSKTATAIYYNGAAITAGVIPAGATATFIYNGTNYILLAVDAGNYTVDAGAEDSNS